MTSTFDNLNSLNYAVLELKHEEYRSVAEIIFKYAVEELDKVNPKITTFEKWKQIHFWHVDKDNLRTQASFADFCHDALDHTAEYHLRCFSHQFLHALSTIMYFLENDVYKKRDSKTYYLPFIDNHNTKSVGTYTDIWLEIVKLEGEKYAWINNPTPIWKKHRKFLVDAIKNSVLEVSPI